MRSMAFVALFGVTFGIAGSGSPALGQTSPNCVESVGDFAATPGSLNDIAVGPGGILYAVDGDRAILYRQEWDETFRELFGGAGRGTADGSSDEAQFMGPYGVAGSDDYVFIADTQGQTIRVLSDDQILTIAGEGVRGFRDGVGPAARFNQPYDLTVHPDGRIYVADTLNHAIRVLTIGLDLSDVLVETVAGTGVAGVLDGPLDIAQLNRPVAVAISGNGDIYIADQGNSRIRRLIPNVGLETWVGSTYGHKIGTRSGARLGYISRLAATNDGILYATDRIIPGVISIDDTGYMLPITGSGAGGGTGNASNSLFQIPEGLTVAPDGRVLITDLTGVSIKELSVCVGDGAPQTAACVGALCPVMDGELFGCTDEAAANFSDEADYDDGTCFYECSPPCANGGICNEIGICLCEGTGYHGEACESPLGDCPIGPGLTVEACDGIDNDCDGFTDEGLGTLTCGIGGCEHSIDACADGIEQVCDPLALQAPEVCDGIDNDCNHETDEGMAILNCGLGECQQTISGCVDGVPQECDAFAGAVDEVCDGLDNDCDGLSDEELGQTVCGVGRCFHTVDNCKAGLPVACDPFTGKTEEICDTVDNDCDGQFDEALGTTTCGTGGCAKTVQNCVAGSPQTCAPLAGKSLEVCDSVDNDCNGLTDEGLGQTTCGIGQCNHAQAHCVGGVSYVCNPMEGAKAETCDGLDNDCDGGSDEDWDINAPCDGPDSDVCNEGIRLCTSPTSATCTDQSGNNVDVCDNKDNDCDGTVDEGFPDNNQNGLPDCLEGVEVDSTPPSFGGLISAVAQSPTVVALSWNAAVDSETAEGAIQYEICRSTVWGGCITSFVPQYSIEGSLNYTVTGLSPDTTYYFLVRSRDSYQNLDLNISERMVQTQPDTSPPSFDGLSAVVATSSTEIDLSWGEATDDTTPAGQIRYHICQSTSAGACLQSFESTHLTAPGTTSLSVTGLTPVTTYYFLARAEDIYDNLDANTNEVERATPPDTTPPTFAGLETAVATGAPTIELAWSPSTDNATPQGDLVYDVCHSRGPRTARVTWDMDGVAPPNETVTLGSTVVFEWTDYHTVATVPSLAALQACDMSDNTEIGNESPFEWTPPEVGDYFVVCPVGQGFHCDAGMSVVITVVPEGDCVSNFSATYTTVPGAVGRTVTNLDAESSHSFVVQSRDSFDNRDGNTVERSVTTPKDTTPPSFGGIGSADPLSPSKIAVTWTTASDDVSPPVAIIYELCWSTGDCDPFVIGAETAAGTTQTTLTGLTPNTTYTVRVRARDEYGNVDANTGALTPATPPDVTAPVFGGVQLVTNLGASAQQVFWTAATDDATSPTDIVYLVCRSTTAAGCVNTFSATYTTPAGVTDHIVSGLVDATTYYYVVRARDAMGNVDGNATWKQATTPVDTTAPVFAGIATASAASNTSMTITWAAANDDVTAAAAIVYRVCESTSSTVCAAWSTTYTTAAGALSHTISGKINAGTYYYRVRAVDAKSNVDTNTVQKSATIVGDITAPTFSGISTATKKSDTEIDLTWSAATDDVTASGDIIYRICRSQSSTGCATWSTTYTTAAGATSYSATSLSTPGTYYFRVRAKDTKGNVDTNTTQKSAAIAGDISAPTFAGASNAEAVSKSAIKVSWVAATDAITATSSIAYQICKSSTENGCANFSATYTTTGTTSYQVEGLSENSVYYFRVRAKDLAGNIDTNTTEVQERTYSKGGVLKIAAGTGGYDSGDGDWQMGTTEEGHTCVAMGDGHARCWGQNNAGQLGRGFVGCSTCDDNNPTTIVSDLDNVTDVSVGLAHSCALTTKGDVYCWGLNDNGQAGGQAWWYYSYSLPIEVLGLNPNQATMIDSGRKHSCARLTSSHVACWGNNTYGQIGNGNTIATSGSGARSAGVPTQMKGVATGHDHTCSWSVTGGDAYCWGRNGNGQVTGSVESNKLFPTAVSGVSEVVDMALGRAHTCALKVDGKVYCWGANDKGQLAGSSKTSAISGLTMVKDIEAAADHTCALKANGTVTCWGDNSSNQLGFQGPSQGPGQVSGLSLAMELAVGAKHSCAVKADGNAYCWGANGHGQLGLGNYSAKSSATELVDVGSRRKVRAVDLGDETSCALLTDGTVKCWGSNDWGQAGYDGPNDCGGGGSVCTNSPKTVPGLDHVVQVDASQNHSCAIRADGTVWCWGNNVGGAFGPGVAAGQTASPKKNTAAANVKDLGLWGNGGTCAVKSDGRIDCWGVSWDVSTFHTTSLEMAAGWDHYCVLEVNGRIWCAGTCKYGQCGQIRFTGNGHIFMQGLSIGYTAVKTSHKNTCAIGWDGYPYCLGSNDNQQVDMYSQGSDWQESPNCEGAGCFDTPHKMPGVNRVADIGSSGDSSCMLQVGTGSVVCQNGFNIYGVCGCGSQGCQCSENPRSEVNVTSFRALDTGGVTESNGCTGHSCAIRHDGDLYCWGSNFKGQIGNGENYTGGNSCPGPNASTEWGAVKVNGL